MSRAELVRAYVAKIPRGRVSTYGHVAAAVGMKGARAVGTVLHGNTDPVALPCHRVVNREGRLAAGYAFGGPEAQRKRLVAEGVRMKADDPLCVDLSAYGWKPDDALPFSA